MRKTKQPLVTTLMCLSLIISIFLVACSNNANQPNEQQNNSIKPNQSTANNTITCAKEGETFSFVYKEYPRNCCSGLTEWQSGFDTSISVADKCYQTGLTSGAPVGTCINCGDGICGSKENPCNCPSDCVGKDKSTFKTITEFCDDQNWKLRLTERTELNKDLYDLCPNHCGKAGEAVGMGLPLSTCCVGLTKITGSLYQGECSAATNGAFFCSDCGNAVCESWENVCSCPIDCNVTTCTAQGNAKMPGDPACCSGLTEAIPYPLTNINNNCTGAVPISPRVCIKCGDYVCGAGENKCNCPNDCS